RLDRDVGLLDLDLVLDALQVVAGLQLATGLVEGVGHFLHVDLAHDVERVLGGHDSSPSYFMGTVATPRGGVNVNWVSGRFVFTATRLNCMVTVFSNWSWTTALRSWNSLASTASTRRVSVGSGRLGARS